MMLYECVGGGPLDGETRDIPDDHNLFQYWKPTEKRWHIYVVTREPRADGTRVMRYRGTRTNAG
jgi:hypothetical protein